MDHLSVEQRSSLMSRIRSRDTQPEMAVRTTLHRLGFRYRLHVRALPGCPDLVFPSSHKVIFVNGCYWHWHTCKRGRTQSKTNKQFWVEKMVANRDRDKRVIRRLRRLGWGVLTVWECQIASGRWLSRTIKFLEP